MDPRTHTVYVANRGSGTTGTVSVFNAAPATPPTRPAAANLANAPRSRREPGGIAVDTATDTVYVATITASGPNLISVFNGATCNATTTTGCGQTPATLSVGDSGGARRTPSSSLAVNQATNTIYATSVTTSTPLRSSATACT